LILIIVKNIGCYLVLTLVPSAVSLNPLTPNVAYMGTGYKASCARPG